jgi:hypothetical protein
VICLLAISRRPRLSQSNLAPWNANAVPVDQLKAHLPEAGAALRIKPRQKYRRHCPSWTRNLRLPQTWGMGNPRKPIHQPPKIANRKSDPGFSDVSLARQSRLPPQTTIHPLPRQDPHLAYPLLLKAPRPNNSNLLFPPNQAPLRLQEIRHRPIHTINPHCKRRRPFFADERSRLLTRPRRYRALNIYRPYLF